MHAPSLKLNPTEAAFALFVGLSLGLDIPAAKAYNDHTAWTEMVGRFLFHGCKELFNVPIPFTPFEVITYGSVGILFLHFGWQRARYWLNLIFLSLLLPSACAFAAITGWMRGNSLPLAMTQLHFIPMLTAWMCLGYFVGTRPLLHARLCRILFWVCVWRSLYALFVFLVPYHGSMQDYEYLIDHSASIFLATGMAYGGVQMWFQRRHKLRVLGYAAAVGLMSMTHLLNDRRASLAGLSAAVLILPWIMSDRLRRAILRPYKMGMGFAIVALVFASLKNNDQYSFVGALQTETLGAKALTYRHIENFNLLSGMIEQPLLGMGFGTRFPHILELPDITFAFELFDAIPHNSVYFLWAFGGPLGIASLMTLSCGLLCIITRVGRAARYKSELLVAIIGLVVTCQWLMYVLFDMGLLDSRCLMMIGLFAGSLFPLYGRLLLEHRHGKIQKHRARRTVPPPPQRLHQPL